MLPTVGKALTRWDSDPEDDTVKSSQLTKKQSKRRKLAAVSTPSKDSLTTPDTTTETAQPILHISRPRQLPVAPFLQGCRSVDHYEKLNRIEEGSYGIVYRARDRQTGEIVALKKLKLQKEVNGFPVTSLREIHTLLIAKHPHIVHVKEIVTTPSATGIFIVMEYLDHDLKALMEDMPSPFLLSEIKTLMKQLLSAVACLHRNWIMHRDLKTSNLLMNNRGRIKVADFGLARKYGSPLGPITQLVVTLWYRAPELLLGAKEYTTAIDMWSVGCIFGELVNKEPLVPGRGEMDQLSKIFKLLGTPTASVWPGFADMPLSKTVNFHRQPYNNLRSTFQYLPDDGLDLMARLLAYDPETRITAEEALNHPFFLSSPLPKDPDLFPTFPSKAAGERRRILAPDAPQSEHQDIMGGSLFDSQTTETGTGFRLRV
ncbi:hypothetical protein BASA50_009831 [Batrachochytrium salamandrivorans]|uniref:Protein kinase domain-containing protein n=1 Tax=Batrachochytrium salamandrivorans TaxID=1357716 RepID=A0ABQ8F194_9FUNG|nr:hypothetical protein BASA61_008909 [Batrachochytrium salamandrivorans]KAH6589738.1 hypothetical protein BASA50_009831 [Batrachochytrium salamandrivorans]KAH9264904.1 hypothetical protein BASA83_011572 [Batrachochytrium salamandrivorans]